MKKLIHTLFNLLLVHLTFCRFLQKLQQHHTEMITKSEMQTGTCCVKCNAHYVVVTKLVPNIWFWSVVFRVICTIYSMFLLHVAFKHSILCVLLV